MNNNKAHLYILTDGNNTKIGITENLEKRIQAYNTHNPNYKQYRIFDCDIQEARRIEAAVKSYYKDKLSGSSKEWFQVPPEKVCEMVKSLFNTNASTKGHEPIVHGLNITDDYSDLLYKIICKIDEKKWTYNSDKQMNREAMAMFGELFQLGVPNFNLDTDKVIVKDYLSVDLNHYQNPLPFPSRLTEHERAAVIAKHANVCITKLTNDIRRQEWEAMWKVKEQIEQQVKHNSIHQLPFGCNGDSCEFFVLINLPTGYQIAIATARVVFPRLENFDYGEIVEFTKRLGLNVFRYDEWSPVYPGKTGLLVLMQKTSIKDKIIMFNSSFRRWVIENYKILEQELHKYEYMLYSIRHDSTFPLHIQTMKDIEDYCECFGFPFDDEEQQVYGHLLDKWKKATA